MIKSKIYNQTTESGFTLVELLVSILIVLMITGLVVASTGLSLKTMQNTTEQGNADTLSSTLNTALSTLLFCTAGVATSEDSSTDDLNSVKFFMDGKQKKTLLIPDDNTGGANQDGHIIVKTLGDEAEDGSYPDATMSNLISPGTYMGLKVVPHNTSWFQYSLGANAGTGVYTVSYDIVKIDDPSVVIKEVEAIFPEMAIPDPIETTIIEDEVDTTLKVFKYTWNIGVWWGSSYTFSTYHQAYVKEDGSYRAATAADSDDLNDLYFKTRSGTLYSANNLRFTSSSGIFNITNVDSDSVYIQKWTPWYLWYWWK